jgi:hypothetical protein
VPKLWREIPGHKSKCVVNPYDDPLIRRLRGPSPVMPSDIEIVLRELAELKREVKLIRKALERHGIKIEEEGP